MTKHIVEGHAIVSVEGAIADAGGVMPQALRNEADWAWFQGRLDASDLTALGRLGHAANPNFRRRRRLVFSARGRGLEPIDDLAHRLNPNDMPIAEALSELLPQGGHIAIAGGTGVFDAFLEYGYSAFHLTIAGRARIVGGRPVFSGVGSAAEAEAKLVAAGLFLQEMRLLDPANDVVLKIFARA